MKLAVIGANGRTGVAVVRAALRAGLQVLPVVRDDRDLSRLLGLPGAEDVRFADFNSSAAVAAAIGEASVAVAAIQPRCLGHGALRYRRRAAEAILTAARDVDLQRLLWVSTMGCFQWSGHEPSKASYELEFAIRQAKGPWAIAKFSAYHDEILEAYVAPEDRRAALQVPRNGHWAPISRSEAGQLALHCLPRVPVKRTQCLGGPELFTARQLARLVARFVPPRGGRLTAHTGIPAGDHAVLLDDTLTTVGTLPTQRLEPWLQAQLSGEPAPPLSADPPPVYPRSAPGHAALDDGATLPLWDAAGPVLRGVVHRALERDLRARSLPASRLDFTQATARAPHLEIHGGRWSTLRGVRALAADGAVLLEGEVGWLRDELAEEFHVFFGRRIPDHVWDELDLGVKRSLADLPRYRRDKRIKALLAR